MRKPFTSTKYGLYYDLRQNTNSAQILRGVYSNIYAYGTGNTQAIYNYIRSNGTGAKTGMYNDIRQNSASNKSVYGVHNRISANGTGEIRVTYNHLTEGSGLKTGTYNDIRHHSSSTTSSNIRGIYNRLDGYGSGKVYGMYNYIRYGSGAKYGLYNLINQPTSSNQATFGVYASTVSHSTKPNYSLYGIYAKTQKKTNAGQTWGQYLTTTSVGGALRGIHSVTTQESTNTSTTTGIQNHTKLNGTGTAYGLYNIVDIDVVSTGTKFGIDNRVTSNASGTTYGIRTKIIKSTGSGTKYALYSEVDNNIGYAGFFKGDVAHNGTTMWTSDAQLKEDIVDIDNALAIVADLQPRTYRMRYSPTSRLSSRLNHGFIAQELEGVLPSLVQDIEHPGEEIKSVQTEIIERIVTEEDEEGNPIERIIEEEQEVISYEEGESITLKGVNYIELIPILTKAIQEQQTIIKTQQDAIEKLQAAVAALEEGN